VISRRDWLRSAIVAGATLVARGGGAQQQEARIADTSNLFPMDQSAARSVRLPPKPVVAPSMTPDERDALEHRLRCQCGCTLDVFTCRTTDFSCQVSPSMHRDIMSLVQGGYTAQEILDAFVNVYGDRVLMAPPRVGFNIVGYLLPSVALAVGAIVLAVMIRRWKVPRRETAAAFQAPAVKATPEEIARLDAAIRDDS
jgi:cytochrome c-type biogenesis protein CcmH